MVDIWRPSASNFPKIMMDNKLSFWWLSPTNGARCDVRNQSWTEALKEQSFWVPFPWNKCEGVKRCEADKRGTAVRRVHEFCSLPVNRKYPDSAELVEQIPMVKCTGDEMEVGMPRLLDGIRVKAIVN
ncbi:uncharacterized protein LOC114577416 [Apis cerana]|uniref:uncharacterized protein LOC114577416 n=1 Tax=Apis cerana TaxID=7461 RepID=UPI00109B9E63|nr:uncharacterized protein LOC114577416 [Apis cerana]XP_061939449.1 uncharacterized protein LOC114577416 [Apis cerana]